MFRRRSEKRVCFMKTMTRRQFLRAGVGLAAVASSLEIIAGCASTETPKVTTLVYPSLPYNKIQPPQEGCFVGFFIEPEASLRMKDSTFIPQRSPEIEATQKAKTFDEFADMLKRGTSQISNEINYVEKALNAKPFIYSLPWSKLYSEFPVTQAMAVAKSGIVPFVYGGLGPFDIRIPVPGFGPKEIAQGQCDSYIKKFAQGAAEFGKEYGGFFFTTMEEMNGNWFSWGMNSNFIPAWRHIWQIFEDKGSNQYATWVWDPYCPEGVPLSADSPKLYYPGDKYVDWIGLCAISVAEKPTMNYALNVLIRDTYRQLSKDHPQKPFVISSFGRTNEIYQSRWLINAYNSIKNSFPAIKAAIYFHTTWWGTGDHTLNPKSLKTLKEVFKDPYWIMGK
jgi:hypothetical protein